MTFITAIGTANPGKGIPQSKIADFMTKGLELNENEGDRLRVLYRATGIQQRYSVIPDYGLNGQPYTFYAKNRGLEPFPTMKMRMEHFKTFALDLSIDAIHDCIDSNDLRGVTHLITVSCTGMYAPGLDIELIERLKLNSSIERTAINFMGCYAAFNALRVADKICQSTENAKVLVVCVELCSLHFQKNTSEEALLANSLFSDGAAAIVVESNPTASINLEINKFHCDVEPEGKHEMTWDIGDFGFEMKLSDKVPAIVEGGIRKLTDGLMSQLNLGLDEIDFFAIHPGGKKILKVIEEQLSMNRGDNRFAYDVLRRFGNMSSPTVLFVIKSIMNTLGPQDTDSNILSFAFGPGLTLESMLLKVKASA